MLVVRICLRRRRAAALILPTTHPLACVLSKTFETHILGHLESHFIHSDHQFDFRCSRSTVEILISIIYVFFPLGTTGSFAWKRDISKDFDHVYLLLDFRFAILSSPTWIGFHGGVPASSWNLTYLKTQLLQMFLSKTSPTFSSHSKALQSHLLTT